MVTNEGCRLREVADEAALASGKQRKVDAVSFVAMLDRVKANLRTLDFHGKRLALEALAERVVAGKDPATWRQSWPAFSSA